MIQQVSILGCGWLGLPLAKALISHGFNVKGSTTTEAKLEVLRKNRIQPFMLNLPLQSDRVKGFFDSEVIIIAFPPGLRNSSELEYLEKIESLTPFIRSSPARLIIYIGTTSIYQSNNSTVCESDAAVDSVHFKAEDMLKRACGDNKRFIAARCGGLMGYDRYPCKYIKKGRPVTGGANGVNYIHRDDVIGILSEMIVSEKLEGVFNLVAPEHPTRQSVYLNCAQQASMQAPNFDKEKIDYKIVEGSKLNIELSYSFKYPNPLDFYYEFS